MLRKEGRVKAHVVFDTKRKFSIIAVEHPDEKMNGKVRVYVKGAPEFVIEKCKTYFERSNVVGGPRDFSNMILNPDPDYDKE